MCMSCTRREWMQGALCLIPVTALAGSGLMRTAPTNAMDATTQIYTDEMLRFYYRFLARYFHECPTDLQVAAIELAEDIYQHTDGWQKDQRTAEEREKTCAAIDAMLHAFQSQFHTLRLRWTNDGLESEEDISVLELSEGISRYIIVEVENASAEALNLVPAFEYDTSFSWPDCPVNAGAKLPYLIPANIQSVGAGRLNLVVTPNNNAQAARMIPITYQSSKPALITGKLYETGREDVWPGRVYVQCHDHVFRHGKAFMNNATLSEKPVIFRPAWHRLPFFYSDGTFEIKVPHGSTHITLERGFEHEIVHETVSAVPGETHEIAMTSSRYFDMKAHGWISGDTHIHWAENSWDVNEDIELLAMVQRAEDLRVANNLTLYQWTPNGSFTKPDQYPMGPVEAHCNDEYHIQMGEEFRNDNFYGHINLLGITKLIEPIATGPGSGGDSTALDYPINKTIIEECHRQGGISCEAHGFGPMVNGSVPINVINRLSDALDQLDPEFYYLLLDCGFRVPLGNGSDHPARVVGCARVYVKVAGEFTYTKWIDGLREDRSFVTSGPLLFFQVDGEDIGSKLVRNTGDKVKITARAISRHPIGTLQVLTNNGQVLGTLETRANEAEITLEHTIESSQ